MTVSIRAHHLLCMLTYLGKGYTPEFVENYNCIINRLNEGETIMLIEGPDAICQPMLCEQDCHCHNESVRDRDAQAMVDIGKCLKLPVKPGGTFDLTRDNLATLRSKFADGSLRSACAGCEWQALCSTIARSKFRGCHLQLP